MPKGYSAKTGEPLLGWQGATGRRRYQNWENTIREWIETRGYEFLQHAEEELRDIFIDEEYGWCVTTWAASHDTEVMYSVGFDSLGGGSRFPSKVIPVRSCRLCSLMEFRGDQPGRRALAAHEQISWLAPDYITEETAEYVPELYPESYYEAKAQGLSRWARTIPEEF